MAELTCQPGTTKWRLIAAGDTTSTQRGVAGVSETPAHPSIPGHSPCATNRPLFRPPSEANSYILQATIGCSWNNCTYCQR